MFEPEKRQNFLDLLRPPAGYRLEAAVGTTYSLDFVALTAALLAFVDAPEKNGSSTNHIDSLRAITRLADRVRIFANRVQISGPSKVNRATIFYDRIVREINLPKGSFHPKVWITFYNPRETPGIAKRPKIVRVVCTSKNLTTSLCWEAFVGCEGAVQDKRVSPMNTGVGDFITRLIESDSSPSPAIADLREAISKTNFAFAKPLGQQTAFLWQWPDGKSLHEHLPAKGRMALIVSPFVRRSFLEDILNRFEKVTLVSTQRELDAIADDSFMLRLCAPKNRVFVVQSADSEDGSPAMDLHAKILIFECEDGPKTFIGSANASFSAWKGLNCEAIVKFAPGVSIDHFCNRFIFSHEPAKPGSKRPLRGWISEYRRQLYVEDEHKRVNRELDDFCAYIARLSFRAEYDPQNQILTLFLERSDAWQSLTFGDWLAACGTNYDIHIALLSKLHSDDVFKPIADLSEGEITFKGVGIADLTEFLILRVKHRALGLERRRILKAKVNFSKWQARRDSELLQQLLTRDNLAEFFKAILFDAVLRSPVARSEESRSTNTESPVSPLLEKLSIEDILRSCTEDPSRIEEINRLLKAFEKTNWIDQDFRNFWSNFVDSFHEANKETCNHD